MRIKQTELYTYSELSEKAQEKARDWYREASAGDFDVEYIFDMAADAAMLMGFDIRQTRPVRMGKTVYYKPTIYYSGFSSQGDGACCEGNWRAKDVKPGAVAKEWTKDTELQRIAAEFERLALLCPDGRFSVKHRGHYMHKMCTTFDFEDLIPESDDDIARTPAEWNAIHERASVIESDLKEAARDFMEWIYRQLESEWECQNSDEVIADTLVANEYEFTMDGVQS